MKKRNYEAPQTEQVIVRTETRFMQGSPFQTSQSFSTKNMNSDLWLLEDDED